jgi:hypothetical protein
MRHALLHALLLPTLAFSQLTPKITNDKAVSGLKAALNEGISRATQRLGTPDGYLKNALIKVLLPPEAQTAASALQRTAAGRRLVDDLITRLNRAAETAAAQPQTKQIFVDAIKSLTVADGIALLQSDSTGATRLLRSRTTEPLTALYRPVVQQQLDQAGVNKAWTQFSSTYNRTYAFISGRQNLPTDLSAHVTTKALDGLFWAVAREEAKIRRDPAARTTDLLKDVFGSILKR